MTEAAPTMGDPDALELEEQIARIKRALAETDKFAAEQRELSAEDRKLGVEALKLAAAAWKFDRAPALAPWQIGILLAGGIGGFVGGAAGLAAFWHNLLR